jgi:hypothetical protein
MRKIRRNVLFGISVLLFISIGLIYQIQFSSSDNANSLSKSVGVGGGSSVPIVSVSITEQGESFDMKPGRLKFEFGGEYYAVQLRKVKEGYADFIVLNLDKNKLDNVSAYSVKDSFKLDVSEEKGIDLDGDGVADILIGLDEVNSVLSKKGKKNDLRSAGFFVKLIRGAE